MSQTAIHKYIRKIQETLSESASSPELLSLKIIYPCDTSLTTLKTILALTPTINILEYEKLDYDFVHGAADKKIRSLTFLKYTDYLKYANVKQNTKTGNSSKKKKPDAIKFQIREENISLKQYSPGDLSILEHENNAKHFWKAWSDCIRKNFKHGESTLWTYIVLRRFEKPYIASAYLIFSGAIEKNTRILINKICQDLLLESIIGHFYHEINVSSIRSAISQVMARNMSHNIGSHVSYRATNIKVKQRAEELSKGITRHEAFSQWLDHFSEKLDKYEIYRNEYLSDFDQSPRFARFYQDVVLPFCENLLVMDNLAAGEHLNYKDLVHNILKIKCKIDGKEIKAVYPDLTCMVTATEGAGPISYPDNFPYLLKNKRFESDSDKNTLQSAMNNRQIIGAKDVEICLHSEQGIYSILENFIRNSAKHKPLHTGEELVIILDVHTANNDVPYHTLYLYDESSRISPKDLYDKDSEHAIYQRIKQGLLEESGKPRRANWGFADMKINSFLLFNRVDAINSDALANNFDLVVMNEQGNGHPRFETVGEEMIEALENKKYRFGYKIKLSAARKILWVGDFLNGRQPLDFERAGLVWVRTIEEATTLQLDSGLLAFQFAVINVPLTYKEFLGYEEKLPGRVLLLHPVSQTPDRSSRIVKADEKDLADVADMEQLLRWCWQQWLANRNGKANLFMYFMNTDVNSHWIGQEENVLSPINEVKLTLIDKEKTYTLSNDEVNIIYDHHGNSFYNTDYNGFIINEVLHFNVDTINFATRHSLIYFDKGSEDFPILNYPPERAKDREFLLYQIIDAATTNVFIIDERISEYAQNKKIADFQWKGVEIQDKVLKNSAWSMYASGKVFVVHALQNETLPEKNNLCPIGKMPPEGSRLILDITDNAFTLKTKAGGLEKIDTIRKDVLIIHRTYLDREKIGIDPDVFLSETKKRFGAVFVTSGGGYPHNLKSNCKFLPFSILESCVSQRLSKNKLNNLIQSSIKP